MSLSDRINNKFEEWRQDLYHGVGGLVTAVISKGLEIIMDQFEAVMRPYMKPLIDKVLETPEIPDELRDLLKASVEEKGFAWAAMLAGGASGAGTASFMSILTPFFEHAKQMASSNVRWQIFDYPFVLSAWLRGDEFLADYPEDIFNDLKRLGWEDHRIEMFKKLVFIIPPVPDMVRFADFGAFDPEIIAKWQEFYDAPDWIKEPMHKIGIDDNWANKYWFSHWHQPGRYELGLMRARGYIDDDTVKTAYLTQGYTSFWQDLLLKLVWEPYTRVDVRRMYKMGVLDEAGVKKAYMDLNYDEEKAQKLTEFTLKYYALPVPDEEDGEDRENEKNRDLTRSDICDGYRKKILDAGAAGEMLSALGYDEAEVDFYIQREDLKAYQDYKEIYIRNYKSLFVNGIISADQVKSDLELLEFESTEVEELLKHWHIERISRTSRPSRSDLEKFLKAGIITGEEWRHEMVLHGYEDKYIDWYLQEMSV